MRSSRRQFLKRGLSAASLAVPLAPTLQAAIDNTEPLKITGIDAVTFRDDLHIGGGSGSRNDGAEFMWVRLHTDKGLTGYGETYPSTHSQVGALRDRARSIMGRDPRDIDGLWRALYKDQAMRNSGGADMRILSAVNMAQLDILGQVAGLPLYRLLGGRTRSRVRVYNTTTDYWAIDNMTMGPDTVRIARFLADRGITGIKIYPFRATDERLTTAGLENGLKWIRDIRDSVGNDMDIAVDCWAAFDFPSAARLARALEPHNILYLEDAMLMQSPDAYARLAAETSVPICMSETLATRYEYRDFLERKACDVVMFDLSWCGGPSEARRIAAMAEAYMLPVSPHTCGGPLLYFCSAHLCAAVPNFLVMESNYWKWAHQYPYFIANVPVPEQGHVRPPDLPGIGARIRPEIFENGVAVVQKIA